MYITYLLTRIQQNKLNDIMFNDDRVINNTLTASKSIMENNEASFIKLRQHIIGKTQCKNKQYEALFVGEYPLITKDELNLFHSFSSAILHIDKSKVTIDNCNFIWEYCNQDERTAEECYTIFNHLLNNIDENIIKSIFYSLDFDKIKFCHLPIEEKENCLKLIADAIDISSSDQCIK